VRVRVCEIFSDYSFTWAGNNSLLIFRNRVILKSAIEISSFFES